MPKPTHGPQPSPPTELGALLLAWRTMRNLSRGEAAGELGLSVHTVISIETRADYRASSLMLSLLRARHVVPESWTQRIAPSRPRTRSGRRARRGGKR